ncbi:MAG: RidA family protein [bacterium]
MAKKVEYVEHKGAPEGVWTPYTPAVKVSGGTTVYFAGVTAPPPYHHHPHRPEEFDNIPADMAGQTRATLENLKKGLESVGASFSDIVQTTFYMTDLTAQDEMAKVKAEYFGDHRPASTTVQVVRLATDPRCLIEIDAVAVIDG